MSLPEPQGDEDGRVLILERDGSLRGWASDRANPIEVPPLTLDEPFRLGLAFYKEDLAELRLKSGVVTLEELPEEVKVSPLFSQPAPLRSAQGLLGPDGLSGLEEVEALGEPFSRWTVPRPPLVSCRGREAVLESDRTISHLTGTSTAAGTPIAVARLGAERALLVTKNGRFLESTPTGEVLVRTSTEAYAAGFQDPDGTLWLVTPRGGLHRVDLSDFTVERVLSDREAGELTSLAGGRDDVGVELVAIDAQGGALLVYRPGDPAWSAIEIPSRCEQDCEVWRVAWLGPRDFALTNRQGWIFHLRNDRLEQIRPGRGCFSYTAIAALSESERLIACLAPQSTLIRTDVDLSPLEATDGAGGFGGYVILPFEAGAIVIGGDARLAYWRPVDGPCSPTRAGAVDVAQMIPIGEWFVAINYSVDDQFDRTLDPTAIWFRFKPD
ncbi:MAG: hypothetical protein IPG45_38495 [Deltaproteobacteria bacterium]|nr:hypothetical protein [Deltaproteobacteria bacterium]